MNNQNQNFPVKTEESNSDQKKVWSSPKISIISKDDILKASDIYESTSIFNKVS